MSSGTSHYQQPIGTFEFLIAKEESSLGVVSDLSSATLINFNPGFSVDDKQEDIPVRAKKPTLSEMLSLQGKHDCTFNGVMDVIPSGTVDTPPDLGILLKAAGLTETVNASTSVVYTLAQEVSTTLHLVQDMESIARVLPGAVISGITFEAVGDNAPTMSFEGMAQKGIRCNYTTLGASYTGGETTISVTNASLIEVGSFIQLDGDNNSGNGYKVTARSTGSNTIDISPVLGGAVSSGGDVLPYTPYPTPSGRPMTPIQGSVTIDGTAYPCLNGKLSMKNTFHDDRAVIGVDTYSLQRIIKRETETEFQIYLRRGSELYHRYENGYDSGDATTFSDVDWQMGDATAAGENWLIEIPQFRGQARAVEVPEEDALMLTLSGKAMGSAGEDEFSITQQ